MDVCNAAHDGLVHRPYIAIAPAPGSREAAWNGVHVTRIPASHESGGSERVRPFVIHGAVAGGVPGRLKPIKSAQSVRREGCRPYPDRRADQSGPQAVRRLTLSEWLFIAVMVAVAVMVILFLSQQATDVLRTMPGQI